MDPYVRRKIIKICLAWLGVAATVLLAVWMWNYLSRGSIVVTTSDPFNNIQLVKLAETEDNQDEFAAEHTGRLEERVRAGQYRISVSDEQNVGLSSKIVTIKARQTLEVKLDPVLPLLFEPVASIDGQDFYPGRAKIWYLNSFNNYLGSIDSSGKRSLNRQVSFESIQWAKDGFGVGLSSDKRFYSIDDGKIKELSTPRPETTSDFVNYSLADNKQLFIAIGQDIFSGLVPGTMKKIYSAGAISPVLAASNDKLAIISPPQEPGGEGSEEQDDEETASVEIIGKDGNMLAQKEDFTTGASWSPDGDKLALIDGFSGTVKVVGSNLSPLPEIPTSDVSEVAWADNDKLILASASELNVYDTKRQESYSLTSTSPRSNISQLMVNDGRSYVYFLSGLSDKNALRRVNLLGKTGNKNTQPLDVFLPGVIGECYFDYVDLVKPTIVVRYPESLGLGSARDECLFLIKGDLKRYGLGDIGFSYTYQQFVGGD